MSNTRQFAEITNLRDKLRRGLAMLTVASMLMPSGGLASEGTNQGKLKCILPEHTHSEACYETAVICGEEERQPEIVREFTGTFPVHVHKADCYDSEGKLICGMVEKEYYHTHGEFCHDTEGNLVCGLQSQPKHSHTEDCRDGEGNLICGLNPDWPVFTTSAENWKETVKDPGHQHTEACYETKLICGLEEHTHTDECYETVMPVSAVSDELQEENKDQTKPEGDDSGENEETDLEKIEVGLEKTVEEVVDFISGHEEDHNDADQNPENAGKSSEELEQTEVENNNPVKDKAETDEEPTVPQENGQEEEREKEPKEEEPKEKESGDGVTGEGEPVGVEPEDKVTGSEEPGSGEPGEETGKEEPSADGDEVNPLNPTPTDGADIIETEQNPEGQPVEQVQTPEENAEQEIEKIENQGKENPEASPEQNPDKQEPADKEKQAAEQEPADEKKQPEEQETEDEEKQSDEQEVADEGKHPDEVNPDGDPSDGENADEETEPVEEPVKFFEGTKVFEGLDYTVTATIGADACFPEDIELAVREILPGTDEYRMYSGQTADAATDEWSEIGEFARFFDITFLSGGAEVEPQAFIDVQITFREAIPVAEDADVQAIHFSEDGANVIESSTDSVEAAASDPDAVDTVNFTVDSFSVYGFFQRVVITTRVITAGGQTYRVEVTYGQDAGIPEGAVLSASEIKDGDEDYELYRAQAAAALEAGHVEMPGLYDISILDAEGQKVQPRGPVSVSITLENGLESEDIKVVHFPEGIEAARTEADGAAGETEEEEKRVTEETPEAVEKPVVAVEVISPEVSEQTVTFETDGFSVYALAYTVDFHYGNEATGEKYEYSILGGGVISLKTLLAALNIRDFAADEITEVHFSSEELVLPVKVEENTTAGELKNRLGLQPSYSAELTEESIAEMDALVLTAPDWALISLAPFKTDEELVITLVNGDRYVIAVTDGQIVRYYIDSRGDTYEISVIYEDDAGIPVDADLQVTEIAGEAEFGEYLRNSAESIGADSAEISFARFFDITIVKDGNKVNPQAPVQVTVNLTDTPADIDPADLRVIHFGEEVENIDKAEAERKGETSVQVTFEAEGFSVYGVITAPAPTSAADLNGRTFTISRGNYYITDDVSVLSDSSNTRGLGKTTAASEAAEWQFEQVNGAYYRIRNTQSGKYLIFSKNPDAQGPYNTRAHVELSETGSVLKVEKLSNGYRISIVIDGITYYLDEHNGAGGPGYAGWYITGENNTLSFNFNTPASVIDRSYIVVVKQGDAYYTVLNDGTLSPAAYNPEDNTVAVDDPMMWKYDGERLYHPTREAGFTGDDIASDKYYRYIDPNSATGLSEDNENNTSSTSDQNGRDVHITGRNLWNTVSLNYVSGHKLQSRSHPEFYLGIEGQSQMRLKGQVSADEAVEVFLADPLVAENNWKKHTVNHIDISINGTVEVDVPLANGKYYDENGNVVKEVQQNRFEKLHLSAAQVVNPTDLNITAEDMKRARITASYQGSELDNAFYVTGYTGNAEHGGTQTGGGNYTTSPQIRIEGSFLVAKMPEVHKEIDTSQYDSNRSYRNAIRQEHLANRIEYSVSVVKSIEFYLQIPVGESNGEKTWQQLYDAEGKPLKIRADVSFSDSFDYWNQENECPVFRDTNRWYYYKNYPDNRNSLYSWAKEDWEAGDVARCDFSGMDFKLGGQGTAAGTRVYAIEITKLVVDEQGNRIKSDNIGTTRFRIYRKQADTQAGGELLDVVVPDADSVKDLNIGSFSDDAEYVRDSDYKPLHEKTIQVGSEGFGLVYDYDVNPALYYVEEDPDSVRESITDVTGKRWDYKETYIWTEYAWRNHENDNYMHVGRTYTEKPAAGGYKSVPEILGNHYGYNGTDGPYSNDFLEFFVYNVYESPKVDVPVIKSWPDFDGDDAYSWEASFKLQWAPVYPDETKPTTAFRDVAPERNMTVTKEMMTGVNQELIQQYLAGDETLTQEQKDQIDLITFKNLPKFGTDSNGNTFRYQYSLEETSYRVIHLTTGVVVHSWSKEDGYNDPEESTHYQPFYPHDAGEMEENNAEAAAEDANYFVHVSNKRKIPRENEYINVSLSKQWDSTFGTRADDWRAEFELRRFEHTEYRDLSHMTDADRAAEPITVKIVSGDSVISEIQVQPNTGLYLGGNFKPHSSAAAASFTADHPVTLVNGSRPTTLNITASGQNMSNALVRSQEFFVTTDTTFTLNSGEENLVVGNPARVLDTGAGTNPLPDRSFSRTILLDSSNNWETELSGLLLNETTGGDDDNENVTCYEYYFVEKNSHPDGYAQLYRADANGNPTSILSGDSDHQIETNDDIVAVNGPSNRLIVRKLWRGVPDTTGFPAITFTLYQAWADGNDGWIYENPETHTRYENIELSGNSLEWVCPEVLPETKLDGNRSRNVKYYVVENDRAGSLTQNDITTSWQFYYYLSAYHELIQGEEKDKTNQTNAGHQGYFASVPGSDLRRSGGSITICNKMNEYMQLDIQKQFFKLEANGSWNNVTASAEMKKNAVLGFQVIRAVKAPDGKWLNERGDEFDSPVWMDYGEEMLCGYDANGDAVVSRGEHDIFWLHNAGGDWHFRIEDNQGDATNVSAGGSGLPCYGYYIRNGEELTVEYWYSFRETGVYKDLNRTPYPEWDWYSSISPVNAYGKSGKMEAFPKAFHGQDGARIANFQASDLIINKDWIGESTARAVYVKIWRTSGSGVPEDFTAVIADDIQNNHNWQNYVSDTGLIDLTHKCLVIKPNASGNWETSLKVGRALLGSLAETGKYRYYIQEIGYRDANGAYKTNANAVYRPLYNHWVDGEWTASPVQMNDYADNSIQIGEKGQNRLKVTNRNTESTSYTAVKTFSGSQGSTGGQSSVNGYPTDGSVQIVLKLQQRYRYEKTENGTEYVSADNTAWVQADSPEASSVWIADWQDAESASPLYVTLPRPKPAGSILSDSEWYGSAAAWTCTWEGLDVKKLISGSDESGDAVYAQLYYRAVEHGTPEWFNAVISAEDQNGHKAINDASQTQQQILTEKNSILNERTTVDLVLSKEWTSLTGSSVNWPEGYTIDYQLVQNIHLAQADLSDPEHPGYSMGTCFKSVDMTTSPAGSQSADQVHPQATGLNIGKPTDGTDIIASISDLPQFGYYTATAADVTLAAEAGISLTEGTVYPVLYTYSAKETAVKKNGVNILAAPTDPVSFVRDSGSPLYEATITNVLDEIELTVKKKWTRNGGDTEWPEGAVIYYTVERIGVYTPEGGEPIELERTAILTVDRDHSEYALTASKQEHTIRELPGSGSVTLTEARDDLAAGTYPVKYQYVITESTASVPPTGSNYEYSALTAQLVTDEQDADLGKYVLINDLTDVEVTKTWEESPYAESVTVKLYRVEDVVTPPEPGDCTVTLNVSFTGDASKVPGTITGTAGGQAFTLNKNGDVWSGTVALIQGAQNVAVNFNPVTATEGNYTVSLDNTTINVPESETYSCSFTGSVSASEAGRTITVTVNWADESYPDYSYNNLFYDGWTNTNITAAKSSTGTTRTYVWNNAPTSGSNLFVQLGYSGKTMSNYTIELIGASSYSINNTSELLITGIPAEQDSISISVTITKKEIIPGGTASIILLNQSGDGVWINPLKKDGTEYGKIGGGWLNNGAQGTIGQLAAGEYTVQIGDVKSDQISGADSVDQWGDEQRPNVNIHITLTAGEARTITVNSAALRSMSAQGKKKQSSPLMLRSTPASTVSTTVVLDHTTPVQELIISGTDDYPDFSNLPYDTQELNAGNGWHYEWENLPTHNSETGVIYHYYVIEETPADTASVAYTRTEENGTAVTIHNTPVVHPSYASFAVTKQVQQKDSEADIETDRQFTVRLKREKNDTTKWLSYTDSTHYSWGEEASATTWTFSKDGTVSFTGLDLGYTYTAVEDTGTGMVEIDGYSFVPSSETGGSTVEASVLASLAQNYTGTITNRYQPNRTDIKIVKVIQGTETELSGAKFQLKKSNGTEFVNEGEEITVEGNYTFLNLTNGSYQIVETQAPAGYIALTQPIEFTISGGAVTTQNTGNIDTVIYTPAAKPVEDDPETADTDESKPAEPATFTVGNTPGVELPATGGPGTLIFTSFGLALMILAGVLMISRKRKTDR